MEGEEAAVPIVEASTGVETSNPYAGMSQDECVDRILKSLKHPMVRFLRQHMYKAGCPVWGPLLLATNCRDQGFAGGYASKHGITVCCNHMTYQDEINQVVIHELIHAYDDCRAKNMDWKNCAHHACTEIRANHLSGDCHYKRELLRGFMKIRGHEQNLPRVTVRAAISPWEKNVTTTIISERHPSLLGLFDELFSLFIPSECVRRRALKSVQKNQHCSDAAARDAIEAVWDICYNDTFPFERAP